MRSPKASPNAPHLGSPTDSPWFWASAFSAAALVTLVLMGPRFRSRQPQIERQFQARERGGQSVIGSHGPVPISAPGHPMITLGPLYAVFSLLFVVTWSVWLWQRKRRVRACSRAPGKPGAA